MRKGFISFYASSRKLAFAFHLVARQVTRSTTKALYHSSLLLPWQMDSGFDKKKKKKKKQLRCLHLGAGCEWCVSKIPLLGSQQCVMCSSVAIVFNLSGGLVVGSGSIHCHIWSHTIKPTMLPSCQWQSPAGCILRLTFSCDSSVFNSTWCGQMLTTNLGTVGSKCMRFIRRLWLCCHYKEKKSGFGVALLLCFFFVFFS